MAELPHNPNDRGRERPQQSSAAPPPQSPRATEAHFADFVVQPGNRPEPVSHGRLIDALIRLAGDSKAETRGVALEQLNLVIARAADSSTLRTEMSARLPALTEAIRTAQIPGTVSDLIRVAAEFARLTIAGRQCAPHQRAEDTTTTGVDLIGAIAAKLYEPSSATDAAIAERAVCALAQLAPHYNVDVSPLIEKMAVVFPLNMRLLHACGEIVRAADALKSEMKGSPPLRSGMRQLLKLSGVRMPWREAESDAVATIIGAYNAPDNSSAALWNDSIRREHRELEEAIEILGRFGYRQRDQVRPEDAFRATIALATCVNHPGFGLRAIEAIRPYGKHALPCLPALLGVAQSYRYSFELRGEALELAGEIVAHSPMLSLEPTAPGLGVRYAETVEAAIRGNAPELVIAGLRAVQNLGSRGRGFAPAIESMLRSDIFRTAPPSEHDGAMLNPVALMALETMSSIDPSGHTVADAVGRIFKNQSIADDLRLQVVITLGELIEREKVEYSIGDVVFATLLTNRELDLSIVQEIDARIGSIERALSLDAANLPMTSVALLGSKLGVEEKEDLLRQLAAGAVSHPNSTRQILIKAYPHISREPRLDYIAIETLRHLAS